MDFPKNFPHRQRFENLAVPSTVPCSGDPRGRFRRRRSQSLRAFNGRIRKRLDVVCAEVCQHNPTAANDERLLGNGDRTLAESEWRPGNDSDLFDLAGRGECNVDDLSDLHAVRAKDWQSYDLRSVRLCARCNVRAHEESSTEHIREVSASSHHARHGVISCNRCLSLMPLSTVIKQLEHAERSPQCPPHQASITRALLQARNAQKPEARSQKPEARSQKNERKLHPRSCVSTYSTFNKGVREGSHAVAVDDACSTVLHWCGH